VGSLDLQNAVVKKPWGYEYLVFQNDQVALWYLRILSGEATSLHCHPKKKTGLILLAGEAEISFLNHSTPFRAPSKLMIRPGLFHSTKALSADGIHLLEIENPVDKEDLVRFEDGYGREKTPYEGADKRTPIPDHYVRFRQPEEGRIDHYHMHGLRLTVEKTKDLASLSKKRQDAIIAVLGGGLASSAGDAIVSAGDVGPLESLTRLATAFEAPEGLSLLTIEKESES